MVKSRIPKVIHYCWFGKGPLPAIAVRCMLSWRQQCPDYEIIEWNEENFDINSTLYTKQAYEAKKYAFVSDYVRFYVLACYGGVYLDVDVQLLKPLDDLLVRGSYIGCEQDGGKGIRLNPGLGMAVEAKSTILEELLMVYQNTTFVGSDGSLNLKTIVEYTTDIFKTYGLRDLPGVQVVGGFTVYPEEYFSPRHYLTGKLKVTSMTYSIHHYSASWFSPYERLAYKVSHVLGEKGTARVVRIKKKIIKWLGR